MPSLSGKTKWARKIKREKTRNAHCTPRSPSRAFLTVIIHKMLNKSAVSPAVLRKFSATSSVPRIFSTRFHIREFGKLLSLSINER